MSTRYDTNPGSKSADEVQREVQQSRAEVEEAIEAIQERLSPGQLFDQAVDYMRGSGGNEFLRNLGATVRDNPVPIVLMSTGLAWLMLSGRRSGTGHEYEENYLGDYAEGRYGAGDYPAGYYPAGDYRPEYDEGGVLADSPLDDVQRARRTAQDRGEGGHDAPGLAESAAETARSWGAEAGATAQQWSAGARSAVADAGERARRLGADARERLGGAGASLRQGAHGARARAGRYGRRAQRGFFDMLQEQPLVLGAVGLAVGAAIGAALPTTETEDEWLGETRDQMKDRAARLTREQLDKARAAGRAAYETAIEEADRQGLTPEGAMAAVDSAARKAERVAEAATEAAKAEAERHGGGTSGGSDRAEATTEAAKAEAERRGGGGTSGGSDRAEATTDGSRTEAERHGLSRSPSGA
jgi:cell division septum initiation protein DivIVA